jgi:hypothetical protein
LVLNFLSSKWEGRIADYVGNFAVALIIAGAVLTALVGYGLILGGGSHPHHVPPLRR